MLHFEVDSINSPAAAGPKGLWGGCELIRWYVDGENVHTQEELSSTTSL